MGHYKIGRFKIFYSPDRFGIIDEPFRTNLTPEERIGMGVGMRNDLIVKQHDFRIKRLKGDIKKLSEVEFIEKWVNFKFEGEQAQKIALDLISDYFLINKNGTIIDYRDEITKIVDNYNYDISEPFPLGKIIGLKFNLSDSIFQHLSFVKLNTITLSLNLPSIKHIEGDLNNIEIVTSLRTIDLRKDVSIMCFEI